MNLLFLSKPTRVASVVFLGVFAAFIHGAIPFFSLPTLGQAIWALGFADSMANSFPPSLYADNFGIPTPAPPAFGFSAIYPMAVMISMGFHPPVAYSIIFALYLSGAGVGAYWFFRKLSKSHGLALALAALWVASPMIVVHQGYSMVALGMVLLPTYLLTYIIYAETNYSKRKLFAAALLFLATLVSSFMDGYTFIMFAAATGLWAVQRFVKLRHFRSLLVDLGFLGVAFGTSYGLYALYIGKLTFSSSATSFFRGWGADVFYMIFPSRGMHFIPDSLNISIARSSDAHFGDGSVWTSTYLLPVFILVAFVALSVNLKKSIQAALPLVLISIFALWMSLGPSLKVDSQKPEGVTSQLMDEQYALIPTGNQILSENLPGFSSMRASYRWVSLGSLGLLGAVAMAYPLLSTRKRKALLALSIAALAVYAPNPVVSFDNDRGFFNQAQQIESELVSTLQLDLGGKEGVLFVPAGNDFFANYLSSRADFRTYNIGGDKNLEMAIEGWGFDFRAISSNPADYEQKTLSYFGIRYLVVPHFDMLWSTHSWPCGKLKSPDCLREYEMSNKQLLEPLLSKLGNPSVARDHYTIFEIQPNLVPDIYPLGFESRRGILLSTLLSGWYQLEDQLVWSTEKAKLRLPMPKDCLKQLCLVTLEYSVFAASPEKPVDVLFHYFDESGESVTSKITATSTEDLKQEFSVSSNAPLDITILLPKATSPRNLRLSEDSRILGIALKGIELELR